MPSVGKGTYAEVLKKALGIVHISTGDLLRDEADKDTPFGEEIKGIMAKGHLVPDEVILKLIENRIVEEDCKDGFILDGFPRTPDQAKQLEELSEITKVLHFKADDEVIIKRVGSRIVCNDCRSTFNKIGKRPKVEDVCDHCEGELKQREDDKPESFKKRLDIYREKTAPLIEHYDNKGLLVEVTINKNIDEIREKVVKTITDYLDGKLDSIGEIR